MEGHSICPFFGSGLFHFRRMPSGSSSYVIRIVFLRVNNNESCCMDKPFYLHAFVGGLPVVSLSAVIRVLL